MFVCVLGRGLSAPEAELLYMQEVEKIEGYAEESIQAKVVCHRHISFIFVLSKTQYGSSMELVTFNSVKYVSIHSNMSVTIKIRN